MMINFSLLILIIFAVYEIRVHAQFGDSPVTPEERIDLEKRFSAIDLKRLRDLEFSDRSILQSTSNGWTVEEMIRMVSAQAQASSYENASLSMWCEVVFSNQNVTTLLTSAQEINLYSLYNETFAGFITQSDTRHFLRNFVCAYSAQPNSFDVAADSFGTKLLLYMKIQFMKTKVENASGGKRIWLIKNLCCLYQEKKDKIIGYSFLRDEDLDPFKNQWEGFASVNTSKALEKFCNILPFKECPEYISS